MTSSRTLPHLNFLKATLSELFGTFDIIASQHMFPYIRQVAIHLRNAITAKSPESQLVIYNWQYVHCLDFFSTMLGQLVGAKNDSPLHALVFPVTQIILGTINLDPSSQYFPLRFYLTDSLLRLSQETGVQVDFAQTLLQPLDSPLLTTAHPKKKSEKAVLIDFNVTLKVSSSDLAGSAARIYRDQVASRLESSLTQYFNLYTLNPAFPELATPSVSAIREWIEKNGDNCGSKVRRSLTGLVDKLEEHARWVEEKRKGMEFSAENFQSNRPIPDTEGGPLREWMKSHI